MSDIIKQAEVIDLREYTERVIDDAYIHNLADTEPNGTIYYVDEINGISYYHEPSGLKWLMCALPRTQKSNDAYVIEFPANGAEKIYINDIAVEDERKRGAAIAALLHKINNTVH